MPAQAPICHIPPQKITDAHGPIPLPSIPLATPNLSSLVASVNALRQVVQYLAGQKVPTPPPLVTNNFTTKQDKGRWNEISRVSETVRVFNPSDKTQFVDVDRINQLTMGDKVTGEKWIWNRSR